MYHHAPLKGSGFTLFLPIHREPSVGLDRGEWPHYDRREWPHYDRGSDLSQLTMLRGGRGVIVGPRGGNKVVNLLEQYVWTLL